MNLKLLRLSIIPITIVALTACGGVMGRSMFGDTNKNSSGAGSGPVDTSGGATTVGGDLIGGGANSGAGYGANVPGTGSFTVATADGVVARMKNGMGGNVNPLAGNFAKSLAQVQTNLPKVSDPLKATGFDQVQLLAYGACSDLTTGTTPLMQSQYGVTKAGTIAANSAALVAAGIKMLDANVAGLASQSSATPAVTAALQALVANVGAVAGNTSTIAFMSVCIAANTASSSLLGF